MSKVACLNKTKANGSRNTALGLLLWPFFFAASPEKATPLSSSLQGSEFGKTQKEQPPKNRLATSHDAHSFQPVLWLK